jgi:hypothetical protein
MNKKIIAAIGVIALGCIAMLIWAWRTGDGTLVITMAVTLILICGVGSLPLFFSRQPSKHAEHSVPTITVKEDSKV